MAEQCLYSYICLQPVTLPRRLRRCLILSFALSLPCTYLGNVLSWSGNVKLRELQPFPYARDLQVDTAQHHLFFFSRLRVFTQKHYEPVKYVREWREFKFKSWKVLREAIRYYHCHFFPSVVSRFSSPSPFLHVHISSFTTTALNEVILFQIVKEEKEHMPRCGHTKVMTYVPSSLV